LSLSITNCQPLRADHDRRRRADIPRRREHGGCGAALARAHWVCPRRAAGGRPGRCCRAGWWWGGRIWDARRLRLAGRAAPALRRGQLAPVRQHVRGHWRTRCAAGTLGACGCARARGARAAGSGSHTFWVQTTYTLAETWFNDASAALHADPSAERSERLQSLLASSNSINVDTANVRRDIVAAIMAHA
jgi:hypothetical protein